MKNKNPLHKRLFREFRDDFGKYAVIFFFVAGVISLVSGFLVADNSMIVAYNDGFDKYNVEDGNFELPKPANEKLLKKLEKKGAKIYENFFIEETTKEVDSTLRIYENRDYINKLCLMEGHLPKADGEIAIDRMYAQNNHLKIKDRLTVGTVSYQICGLVAFSDYSALFSNNADMMFDATKFGVAVVTKKQFSSLNQQKLHYTYSFRYSVRPKGDGDDEKKSNKILRALYNSEKEDITEFTPRGSNQAICFTGNDMGSDRAMFTMFLYIVIVIIAFVFAVTTSNTIAKEASVIGTLRASGYSKGELIRHYLTMPILVTLFAALVGNILGYTCFKTLFAGMYYNSYSLPTYETVWNSNAFLRTTVIPILIIFLVNLSILINKLSLSPLKFLRHDLTKQQKKKVFLLPSKIKIFSRFRLRILFQNAFNYGILFVGILFAEFILLFGMMLSPILHRFQENICNTMISKYQYIVKDEAKTSQPGVEKFCANSLNTIEGRIKSEEISIYGIKKNSAFLPLDFDGNKIYVSDGFAKKHHLKEGEILTLKENYGTARYGFLIQGIYEYPSSMAVFMDQKAFNLLFNEEEDYFNGYFSDAEITDFKEEDLATTITVDDLTKVSRQLDLSMGDLMSLFVVFGTIMFLLLIYLLSKQVIEKNASAISMAKILGYYNFEIRKLYIFTTTIVVVFSILIGMPICARLMGSLFVLMLSNFSGYLPYYVEPSIYLKMFFLGILCYFLVSALEMRKVKKIPMSEALKNAE